MHAVAPPRHPHSTRTSRAACHCDARTERARILGIIGSFQSNCPATASLPPHPRAGFTQLAALFLQVGPCSTTVTHSSVTPRKMHITYSLHPCTFPRQKFRREAARPLHPGLQRDRSKLFPGSGTWAHKPRHGPCRRSCSECLYEAAGRQVGKSLTVGAKAAAEPAMARTATVRAIISCGFFLGAGALD